MKKEIYNLLNSIYKFSNIKYCMVFDKSKCKSEVKLK